MLKAAMAPMAGILLLLLQSQGTAQTSQPGLTAESALPAGVLADSVGVNVHLNYTSYSGHYPQFKQLLLQSGIKHIRNSITYTDPAPTISRIADLGASGIKSDMLFDVRSTAAQDAKMITDLQPEIELVEGANELDAARFPDWRNVSIADQKKIYPLAHAAHLGVIGPVTTSYKATQAVGDLHDSLDYGNMHNYFAGFNPGTTGWGGIVDGTVYGSLAYNKKLAAIISDGKPVMSTETGYCTLAGVRGAVTPEIAARYLPRLFLEQWAGHVARTYVYEFIDEGNAGCDAALGLVRGDLTPKPGYYAVQSFLQTIGTYRPPAAPARVAYRVDGNLTTIHHQLIQTGSTAVQLLIWNETPSWDVHAGTGVPISVPTRDIKLTVQAPWHIGDVRSFRDTGHVVTDQVKSNGAETTLHIADHVTIVNLRR